MPAFTCGKERAVATDGGANGRNLIERAQRGDRGAFEALIGQHQHLVASVIRQLLGERLAGKVEVDDLLQETFIKAWESIEQLKSQTGDAFQAWLKAIARNVVQEQGRRFSTEKRAAAREISLAREACTTSGNVMELVDLLSASTTSPSRVLRRDARFERLRDALSLLSPDHRKVIFLVRVRGLPVKEVARRMGQTPNYVSVLLFRALKELKKAFGATESLRLPHRSLEDEGNGHDE